MKKLVTVLVFVVFLVGCPSIVPVAQNVLKAVAFVSSVLDNAQQTSRTWFELYPDDGRQAQINAAIQRARQAAETLRAVAQASKSASEDDVRAARTDVLIAYQELEALFGTIKVEPKPGMKAATPPRIVESARVEAALKEE